MITEGEIKFLKEKWDGYLSEEHYGYGKNKKTPEMLLLEYRGAVFSYEKSSKRYKWEWNDYDDELFDSVLSDLQYFLGLEGGYLVSLRLPQLRTKIRRTLKEKIQQTKESRLYMLED